MTNASRIAHGLFVTPPTNHRSICLRGVYSQEKGLTFEISCDARRAASDGLSC
jgi:hypothetical protein